MADKELKVVFKGTDEVTKPASSVEKAIGKVGDRIKEFQRHIAEAFALDRLIDFFKESIKEAAEADRAMALLAQAIRNVGGNVEATMPGMERLIDAMARMSGKDDEDVANALSALITKTGSLRTATDNLGLVLDVAAKKQIDLGAAADLVGRALNGQQRAFKELGIVGGTHLEQVERMRKAYHGMAEEEGKTLEGQLGRLHNAWKELKEAIGGALTQGDKGRGLLDVLATLIENVTTAVEQNQEGLQLLASTMAGLVRGAGTLVLSLFSGIAEAAYLLVRGYEAIASAEAAISWGAHKVEMQEEAARLGQIADGYQRAAASLDKLARTVAGQSAGQDALDNDTGLLGGKTGPLDPGSGALHTEGAGGGADDAKKKPEDVQKERIEIARRGIEMDATRADSQRELFELEGELTKQLENGNLTLAQRVELQSRLADVNKSLGESFKHVGDDAGLAAMAIQAVLNAGSIKGAIRELQNKAKLKVGENVAEGLEEDARAAGALAVGSPTAALHAASAKGHFISAVKWAALGAGAGLVGSGAGGGAGGGGSAGTQSSMAGTYGAQPKGTATIVLGKGAYVDTTNPDFMDFMANVAKSLGDRNIIIRREG